MTSPDWTRLRDVIAQAEHQGTTIGVSIISPGREGFSHNGDRKFVAASTVKIPIMIELFRQVDSGELALETRHAMTAADKAPGSGVIGNLHEGVELTLGDLAYLMISISDNSATNILIDKVGMDRVNATMQDLGMRNSALGRRMQGRPRQSAEHENWAAPDDYAASVAGLLDNRAASPNSCAAMLALLEKQQNDRRIARHLPRVDRPRWGSKTGSLPGVVNDVGFIMTDTGPVILAVFCENVEDPNWGEHIIGDIAQAAWDGGAG